nr:hypothetical protein Iba_chr04bCG19550 [Ipomoea batatas]
MPGGIKSKALSSLSEDDILIASPNQGHSFFLETQLAACCYQSADSSLSFEQQRIKDKLQELGLTFIQPPPYLSRPEQPLARGTLSISISRFDGSSDAGSLAGEERKQPSELDPGKGKRQESTTQLSDAKRRRGTMDEKMNNGLLLSAFSESQEQWIASMKTIKKNIRSKVFGVVNPELDDILSQFPLLIFTGCASFLQASGARASAATAGGDPLEFKAFPLASSAATGASPTVSCSTEAKPDPFPAAALAEIKNGRFLGFLREMKRSGRWERWGFEGARVGK